MLGFGLLIGIIFPYIVVKLGLPPEIAYKASFVIVCIVAGLIVGGVNILFARLFIERKISKLSDYMNMVNDKLTSTSVLNEDISEQFEDFELCLMASDKIGDNARAFKSLLATLYEQFNTQRKICDFSNLLNENLEIDVITEKALIQFVNYVSAKGGALALERKGELYIAASYRLIDAQKILDSDIPFNALSRNERQYLSIPEDVKLDGLLAQYRPSHTFIEPIIYKDVPLGLLIFTNDKPFDDDNFKYIDILINNLSMAINNALVHDQLSRLAAKDSLTNLYNRRYGINRLKEEYSRTVRNGAPFGVALIDVDHFKKINDTYGHLIGDRVLVEMSSMLQRSLREGDVAIRYGGEEFMILLMGAAEKDCLIITERVRRIIEDMIVQHQSQQIKFTVSIGLTSYPECDVSNVDELINVADKALYFAKDNGRNQIHFMS